MKRSSASLALVPAILLALAGTAGAQQVKSLGANPSSDQLIQALTPESGTPPLKFRGIRLLTAKPAGEAEARAPAVALDVKFAINSAELTPEAKETIKQLAAAMKSDQLTAFHFLLEGHTDSSGRRDHNMELSKRRAESVRDYLVASYGIGADRLATAGKGPDEPLDKANPASAVNRRVQIVNLGQ
jgi:outer membrane protein OmpA-like peptidoglycan-associated protein